MGTKYEVIKQLIDLWGSYEEEVSEEHNLLDFSEWMIELIKKKSIVNTRIKSKPGAKLNPQIADYIHKLDPQSRFQEHILRIARFEEFYIRKYLIDLPINSRLEYLFLYTIGSLEKVKKTDLINIHSVEYTTGMDTIRRLLNNNFLSELRDDKDKRAKMLVLSLEGQVILEKANKRISEARHMFLECISPNKWKKALPVLQEIDEFHTNIYMNHYDKPFAEISNLMDSLKHIYK